MADTSHKKRKFYITTRWKIINLHSIFLQTAFMNIPLFHYRWRYSPMKQNTLYTVQYQITEIWKRWKFFVWKVAALRSDLGKGKKIWGVIFLGKRIDGKGWLLLGLKGRVFGYCHRVWKKEEVLSPSESNNANEHKYHTNHPKRLIFYNRKKLFILSSSS